MENIFSLFTFIYNKIKPVINYYSTNYNIIKYYPDIIIYKNYITFKIGVILILFFTFIFIIKTFCTILLYILFLLLYISFGLFILPLL